MNLENQVIRMRKNNKRTIHEMQLNATIYQDKYWFFHLEDIRETIYKNRNELGVEIEEIHLPYLVLSGRAVRILEPFFA